MNTYFVIHDGNGRILRCGSCPDDAIEFQAQPGETLLVVTPDINHTDFYIVDGAIIPYTDDELHAKRNLAPGHIWKLPERIAVDSRSIDHAKAIKLAEMLQQCDAELLPIKNGYPASEQQTWDKQEREARAFVTDDQAVTPILTALATARGITVSDLANRVIAKADAFSAYSGQVIGKRQRYEDEIQKATTVADVDAVTWGEP